MIFAVSGICPVEHLGAGRMIRWLESEKPRLPDWKILYASNKSGASASLRKKQFAEFPGQVIKHFFRRAVLYKQLPRIAAEPDLLLLHFQEIGFDWCLRLLQKRTLKKPVWFYLFDSAFFCRKSYNHHDGENSACLRCVGGQFQEADHLGCESYPRKSKKAVDFLKILQIEATQRRVGFLAQNHAQNQLARRHFGPKSIVETVGVWTDDLEELAKNAGMPLSSTASPENSFDVVFHGNPQATKGFFWALEVARHASQLRFLFPCAPPPIEFPANCHFIPMRWDSGLSEHVRSAPVTLVPSLWSAPIEGALIKTFLIAPKVAVVDIPSAFSSEFQGDLLLRLSAEPQVAAHALEDFFLHKSSISAAQKSAWMEAHSSNRFFLQKIDRIMQENAH